MTILFDTETTTGHINYRGFLSIAARESGATMDEGGYWTTTIPEMEKFAEAIEVKVLEKLNEQEPVAYYTCQGNWPRIVLAIDGNSDGYETPLYALEKK